jgi:hypothetical protein
VLVAGGKMFSSKQEIITDTAIAIPSAVSVCAKLHRGDLTTCNKSSLMRKVQTLEEKTACGDTWTIAASATEVVLTYPLTSLSPMPSTVTIDDAMTLATTYLTEYLIYLFLFV